MLADKNAGTSETITYPIKKSLYGVLFRIFADGDYTHGKVKGEIQNPLGAEKRGKGRYCCHEEEVPCYGELDPCGV